MILISRKRFVDLALILHRFIPILLIINLWKCIQQTIIIITLICSIDIDIDDLWQLCSIIIFNWLALNYWDAGFSDF